MPQKFTKAEFDQLPALVSRSEFRAWTGLSDRELSRAVHDKVVPIYHTNPRRRAKYFKFSIATLNGFQSATDPPECNRSPH